LSFTLASSDNDPVFGMNTPAYFAIDNVTFTPEPGSAGILALSLICLACRRKG
jgi:Domain of unknown function (DUF4465)